MQSWEQRGPGAAEELSAQHRGTPRPGRASLRAPQDTRHRPAQPLMSLLPMASQWICALATALAWGCAAASSSSPRTAAAPQDLHITDPGLLGSLDIEWKPPPNAQTFNDCTVKYRFEHHSAGDRDWKVIFTKKLKVRAGFDLSRIAEVRVQTLLEGRCTDGVEVQSDWIYATFQVPLQGKLESEVQNFHCIYHDWEYLKCTWQPGLLTPRSVRYGLYYWYEGLDHAVQCDTYVQEHGVNIGCVLQNLSQAEYKDLSICVNGSVATALLRPLYITLRLHNLAKPSPPEQLVVSMPAAQELHLAWTPPSGKTPSQCLEYEVQLAEDDGEDKASWAVGIAHTVPGGGMGEPCPMASSGEAAGELGLAPSCRWCLQGHEPVLLVENHRSWNGLGGKGSSKLIQSNPCHGQGHLQPHQVAQNHIQPGLQCLQGWGIHHLWTTCARILPPSLYKVSSSPPTSISLL
uniref:Interleukin 13 receptor subunit alpha 2 n=1 Tax=Amazona collaria TaxID=241587 RepID=A0A8B9GBL4_9PSIT